MTDLSPTAKALLEAYENSPFEYDTAELTWIAAVLRATADQVVPGETAPEMMRGPDLERLAQRQHTRAKLLAIATELEISARD